MVNRRPSPDIIAARQWEIKRRYSRKVKVGKRTRSMAAIRLAELTRWLDDTCGAGAELDPSDQSVLIARIFAHHMAALPDTPRRVTVWCSTYAPWISPRDLERLISEVTDCPIKWTADKLAWKLKLTDATRSRLKIRTIGAIDCNADQRKERRKIAHAERQRRLRASKRAQHIG